jgi:hypothetical protein
MKQGAGETVSNAMTLKAELAEAEEEQARPGWQIGFGRPALEIADLPTPEEAFSYRGFGIEEKILSLLGPGVIGLGISIGVGEWVLAPQVMAVLADPGNLTPPPAVGILWVVMVVSVILQVFYNVELGRYTLATGESPLMGFGRAWPGYGVWTVVALMCLYLAFILGSWTVGAGQSLYVLAVGRPLTAGDLGAARQVGIGLLAAAFGLLLVGRKIERTMELIQGAFLPYILIGLALVTVVIVPGAHWSSRLELIQRHWSQAFSSVVRDGTLPAGVDMATLGGVAGFAALASGLNFMFISYYRDKGYGMGYRTGFLSGLVGGEGGTLRASGCTFPENEANAALWKRWFRYLLVDQWGVYFIGCLMGIVLPSILGGYLVESGAAAAPSGLGAVSFIAMGLGARFGQLLAGWALLIGFVILFTTQIAVLELLTRNLTEGLYMVRGVRVLTDNDARKIYYPAMLVIILVISVIINVSNLVPASLANLSSNLSTLAALIFPLILLYLNSRLPRPARIGWWSRVALLANAAFFGLMFILWVRALITGALMVQ